MDAARKLRGSQNPSSTSLTSVNNGGPAGISYVSSRTNKTVDDWLSLMSKRSITSPTDNPLEGADPTSSHVFLTSLPSRPHSALGAPTQQQNKNTASSLVQWNDDMGVAELQKKFTNAFQKMESVSQRFRQLDVSITTQQQSNMNNRSAMFNASGQNATISSISRISAGRSAGTASPSVRQHQGPLVYHEKKSIPVGYSQILLHKVRTNATDKAELKKRCRVYAQHDAEITESRIRMGKDAFLKHKSLIESGFYDSANAEGVRKEREARQASREILAKERHAILRIERHTRKVALANAVEERLAKQREESVQCARQLNQETWTVLCALGSRLHTMLLALEKDRNGRVAHTRTKFSEKELFIKKRMNSLLHVVRQRKAQKLLRFFRVRAPLIMWAMKLQRRRNSVEAITWLLRRRTQQRYLVFVHAMKSFRKKVLTIQRAIRLTLARKRTFMLTVMTDIMDLEAANIGAPQTIELEKGKVPHVFLLETVSNFYATQLHKLRFEIRAWLKDMKKYVAVKKALAQKSRHSTAPSAGNKGGGDSNTNQGPKEPPRPQLRISFEDKTIRSLLEDARNATLAAFERHRNIIKSKGLSAAKTSEEMIKMKREYYAKPLPDNFSAMIAKLQKHKNQNVE
eukprot:PhF_6_TR8728/c0_g1_i1/m.13716